jgi:hypothetical protein
MNREERDNFIISIVKLLDDPRYILEEDLHDIGACLRQHAKDNEDLMGPSTDEQRPMRLALYLSHADSMDSRMRESQEYGQEAKEGVAEP